MRNYVSERFKEKLHAADRTSKNKLSMMIMWIDSVQSADLLKSDAVYILDLDEAEPLYAIRVDQRMRIIARIGNDDEGPYAVLLDVVERTASSTTNELLAPI